MASPLAFTHREWHKFLHLHVEILFTSIIHLHIYIQTVVFHSIAFYETGYLHPHFIAKRLPLLLGILKYEQWLLTQQKKNLNNPKHPETTHQIQKYGWKVTAPVQTKSFSNDCIAFNSVNDSLLVGCIILITLTSML